MIKKFRGKFKLLDYVSTDFGVEWGAEAPIEMTPCKGLCIPIKRTGIIIKEIEYRHIHQENSGYVKCTEIKSEPHVNK